MKRFTPLLCLMTLLLAPVSQAEEDYQALRAKLGSLIQSPIATINPAQVDGLFEVEFDNGRAIYSSKDGDFFIDGTLYQVTSQGVIKPRELRIEAQVKPTRRAAIANIDKDDMVVFSPKGDVKAIVNVFTDVDCGYCRKLHREISAYNDLGIEIRYLAFPRAGIGSNSYKKMVAIWCADDRLQAMTASKAGRTIELKTCENPVADQYALGNQLGVRGTPALVREDGQLMPGYLPAPRLAAALGI